MKSFLNWNDCLQLYTSNILCVIGNLYKISFDAYMCVHLFDSDRIKLGQGFTNHREISMACPYLEKGFCKLYIYSKEEWFYSSNSIRSLLTCTYHYPIKFYLSQLQRVHISAINIEKSLLDSHEWRHNISVVYDTQYIPMSTMYQIRQPDLSLNNLRSYICVQEMCRKMQRMAPIFIFLPHLMIVPNSVWYMKI